jgi:hypothetical protein
MQSKKLMEDIVFIGRINQNAQLALKILSRNFAVISE